MFIHKPFLVDLFTLFILFLLNSVAPILFLIKFRFLYDFIDLNFVDLGNCFALITKISTLYQTQARCVGLTVVTVLHQFQMSSRRCLFFAGVRSMLGDICIESLAVNLLATNELNSLAVCMIIRNLNGIFVLLLSKLWE